MTFTIISMEKTNKSIEKFLYEHNLLMSLQKIIGLKKITQLKKFAEKFGQDALNKKTAGFLVRKINKDSIKKIFLEARTKAVNMAVEFEQQMRLGSDEKSKKRNINTNVNKTSKLEPIKNLEKDEFVIKMSKSVEPLLKLFFELELQKQLLVNLFSKNELNLWFDSYVVEPVFALKDLENEINNRLSIPFKDWIENIYNKSTDKTVFFLTNVLEDYNKINKKDLLLLENDLENSSIGKLILRLD